MSSDEHIEREDARFSQNFRSADVRSGDGVGGGRGGDIGSYNQVNSNNIVTHHTTIHIHSDEQLLSISRLPSQTRTSLSSLGSGSRLDLNSRSPNPALNLPYTSGPQIISNAEGRALELSNNDHTTVLAWPFHGGRNQQWFLTEGGQGRMAFMCMKNRKYLALKRLEENAALFLSITPFYWQVSTHGNKYRVDIPKLPQGLPQTNLALSIGSSVASLRPNYETHSTLLYILADTSEHRAKIQALAVAPRNGSFITTPENVVHTEDDAAFIDLYERARFIFDRQGRILDLSGNDHQTVIPWNFHGDWNQQWAIERRSSGPLVALKSLLYPIYMGYEHLSEDAGLLCTPHPVYWELSRDQDGFNLGVPGSHLGIGLVGETTKLRPLYEAVHTRLHFLDTSEATVAEIRRGNFPRTLALCRGSRQAIPDAPRPSQLEPLLSTIDETCFVVGYTGAVLDLSPDSKVLAFEFHGNTNQQWVIRTDGHGGAFIQSLSIPLYIKYDELLLDSPLVLDPSPFTWEVFKDGDGYRFAVPGTNFSLSVGACARMRYLHEQPGTCVYLLDNSLQSHSALRSGIVSYSTIQPKFRKSASSIHASGASETIKPPPPEHSNRLDARKNTRRSRSSTNCIVQ